MKKPQAILINKSSNVEKAKTILRRKRLSLKRMTAGLVPDYINDVTLMVKPVRPKTDMGNNVYFGVDFDEGYFYREFYLDEMSVYHSGLKIWRKGENIAKRLVHDHMEFYKAIGIRFIETTAQDVGAYFWAKCGYTPYKDDWDKMRAEMEKVIALVENNEDFYSKLVVILRTEDPRGIWRLADLPNDVGKRMLVKRYNWRGRLNLSNETAMKRFYDYVTTKGTKS